MTIDQINDDTSVHIGVIKFIRITYKITGEGLITLWLRVNQRNDSGCYSTNAYQNTKLEDWSSCTAYEQFYTELSFTSGLVGVSHYQSVSSV